MRKRGNENQITKDDFEGDDEDKIEDKSSGIPFQRADPDALAKRRFVRSAERYRPVSSSSGTSTAAAGGASSLFANIDLVVVPTSSGGSPITSQSVSSKPRFAMPSLSDYMSQNNTAATTTTAKNPFGSIDLTAACSTDIAQSASQAPKPESVILTEKFVEFIKNADLCQDYGLPAISYLTTMNKLLSEERKSARTKDQNKASSAAMSTTGTSIASESGTETSKSLFATTPAPAPAAFLFGSPLQTSPSAPAATTTPMFSFGFTASGFAGSAPASGLSSGFGFTPAPMTAAPVPGQNVKLELSPVPASSLTTGKSKTTNNNFGEDDKADEPLPPEEKTDLASADDDDWDLLLVVKVRAYNYRNKDTKKARKFAVGILKVQECKETKKRRMALRDGAGKVRINIGLFPGMNFSKKEESKPDSGPVLGSITFIGVNDEVRGGEMFTFVCAREELDGFHKILVESSS